MNEGFCSFDKFDDTVLVGFIKSGGTLCDEAFENMCARYMGLISSIASKFRNCFEFYEHSDIMQEGLIGLFKATRDYNAELSVPFRSFAETCISRQLATAIKAATRLKHSPLNNSVSLNRPVFNEEEDSELLDMISRDSLPNPEDIVINKERYNTIGEKIRVHLSKFELKVLEYYLDGRSYQEIASILDKPQKAIDNALQRIRHKVEAISEDKH